MSWCLSVCLFVRPVSVSLCACMSVPVCVRVYVSSSLCSVCVCECGIFVCAFVCVCVSLLFVSVGLSNFVSIFVYFCLEHSSSISFLLIICIIFNEIFTYNVFDTTYKRVTCSSTPFALLSVKLSVCQGFCV